MARKTEKSSLEKDFWTKTMGLECFPLPSGKAPYASLHVMKEIIELKKGASKKPSKPKKEETDDQISKRILQSFGDVADITEGAITGNFRATIISGPPGLGKSYTVEKIIHQYDPNEVNTTIVTGKMTPPELFKKLWDHREDGQILVIDDCDSVFDNEVSLNLLKAACDTRKDRPRMISYFTEGNEKVSDKDGSMVEKRFEFKGSIIFITNHDFDDCIERGGKMAVHYQALKSRSWYVSLDMRTRKEYMIRVEQLADSLFDGMTEACRREVLDFMWKNIDQLYEVSARSAEKIAGLRKTMPQKWRALASRTLFKKDT